MVSGSAGQVHITKTNFNRFEIPLPPLQEQREIATILNTVDQTIQKTKDIIDQTKHIREGLYQTLFRDWSGDTTSGPIIGEYPEGWELLELSDVTTITDAEHFTPEYTESGIPVLRPGDLSPGRISLKNVEKRVDEEAYSELTNRYTPSKQDIVYSRSQNFAVASRVIEDRRYCLGQDMVVIEPENLKATFLLHLLNSPVVKKQAIRRSTGSTFSRINLGDIRSYKIPVPDEEVQQQIGSALSEVENRINTEKRYLEQITRLKQGLMQDLLSGKVRTTDTNIQVPDEVAQYG
jgi:type I restriction enzyme S subunit